MTTSIDSDLTNAATNLEHGRGSDKNPWQRPGVPQEQPPQPLASAHWLEPERQMAETTPLVGRGLKLTPVFSTAIPPRGVSGAMRRVAYRLPDYKARRWLLLMLADRVDVLEHRPSALLKLTAGVALFGLVAVVGKRWLRA